MALFSWTGGAHHCVVAEPEQVLDDAPVRPLTSTHAAAPAPPVLDSAAGLRDHLGRINTDRFPPHHDVIDFDGGDGGHRIAVAMQWNSGHTTAIATFVDTIEVADGGPHRDGLLDAATSVVNRIARGQRRITGDGPDLTAADVGAGLSAVVAVEGAEPPGADAGSAVARVCAERLTRWLDAHPASAATIVNKAISAHLRRHGAACRG